MLRRGDIRAGLRAGGAWLAASLGLLLLGRALGDGWASLVGAILVPVGLLGAPGQFAVNWGTFQKPLAPINGLVAGGLAGLGSAVVVGGVGLPFGLWLVAGAGAAAGSATPTVIAAGPVALIVYTLALLIWVITIITSMNLAVLEAPAADEL